MTPHEIRHLIRQANKEVEQERVEVQMKVWEENRLANEAESQKLGPADFIQAEWDALDEPFADIDRITRR